MTGLPPWVGGRPRSLLRTDCQPLLSWTLQRQPIRCSSSDSFTGPSTTNTLGSNFFISKGVTVDAAGNLNATGASIAALNALRAIQTFADKKQGTLDAMAYSASVGVTTNVDMGGFILPGTPHTDASDEFDTLASWDPFTAYDPLLALYDEGKVSVRVRIYFLSMDQNADVPMTTQRVLNAFSNFGDDMVRSSGIGEFATSWPLFGDPIPTNYPAALAIVAQRGWAFQQHSLSLLRRPVHRWHVRDDQ